MLWTVYCFWKYEYTDASTAFIFLFWGRAIFIRSQVIEQADIYTFTATASSIIYIRNYSNTRFPNCGNNYVQIYFKFMLEFQVKELKMLFHMGQRDPWLAS
jgi:hypothetical protein